MSCLVHVISLWNFPRSHTQSVRRSATHALVSVHGAVETPRKRWQKSLLYFWQNSAQNRQQFKNTSFAARNECFLFWHALESLADTKILILLELRIECLLPGVTGYNLKIFSIINESSLLSDSAHMFYLAESPIRSHISHSSSSFSFLNIFFPSSSTQKRQANKKTKQVSHTRHLVKYQKSHHILFFLKFLSRPPSDRQSCLATFFLHIFSSRLYMLCVRWPHRNNWSSNWVMKKKGMCQWTDDENLQCCQRRLQPTMIGRTRPRNYHRAMCRIREKVLNSKYKITMLLLPLSWLSRK